MSEYWKSTPTYWCKFCETYVRDTPINKQQHEATGKHQGAIQRSLRKLHKDQQNEEREKQRAKAEVARLKGVVNGKGTSGGSSNSIGRPSPIQATPERQATNQDRLQQLKQLAAMGVAVPEEFRKDMAMAGDWQTVSTKPVKDSGSTVETSSDSKSFGVRKRKLEEDDDHETSISTESSAPQKNWGSRMKTYQSTNEAEVDFDQLMSQSRTDLVVKNEDGEEKDVSKSRIKKEEDGDSEPLAGLSTPDVKTAMPAEHAAEDSVPVVFKKRKAKASKPC